MLIEARHYRNGQAIRAEILNGRITKILPLSASQVVLPFLAPAFFDIQINGANGKSFNSSSLTVSDVHEIVAVCQTHGIGRLLPTLVTNSFEAIEHGLATIARTIREDGQLATAIPGIHVEGPYLSAEDGPRGAHPREHIRTPDTTEFKRWQKAAEGRIRMMTIAPEVEGGIEFISWLTKQEVVVAIGHTNANQEEIAKAVQAGAKTSTHLGNGIGATLPRHQNPIWEQLAKDELMCSVIPDGFHLTPAVLKSIIRVKGLAKMITTCDASSLAGVAPGIYEEWNSQIEVSSNGKVTLKDTPYLAGSGVFTNACIPVLMQQGELNLADAITTATVNPARLMNLPEHHLMIGREGIWMLFDPVEGAAELIAS
jgi:N-acetylglucosamine-6-phosphate deacetylase